MGVVEVVEVAMVVIWVRTGLQPDWPLSPHLLWMDRGNRYKVWLQLCSSIKVGQSNGYAIGRLILNIYGFFFFKLEIEEQTF